MCVLDNTAQGLGQGKKQVHLEDWGKGKNRSTLKRTGMGHGA
jgi:hypothetical protein